MLDSYTHQQRTEEPDKITHFELPPYEELLREVIFDRSFVNRIDSLARPEGLRFCDVEDPEHAHPVIMCRPTLTPGIFALRTQYAKTVTLVVYATGTSPEWLAPIIKQLVDNNVPVFLVADCPGDEAGIVNPRKYGAAIPAIDAGATVIQKVNIRDSRLVKEAAKDLSETLSGNELAKYIGIMFEYQKGEQKPVPEWETPDGIEKYRREVIEPMLIRLGLPPQKASEVSDVWATCSLQSDFLDTANHALEEGKARD